MPVNPGNKEIPKPLCIQAHSSSLRCGGSLCKVRNDNRMCAFTLAEVLITLVIIGVIAALTIPTLMKNYRKHEIETMLKQNYSILQNALGMAKAEYGDPTGWDELNTAKLTTANTMYDFLNKYIVPYIKTVKGGNITLRELGYRTPIYGKDGQTVASSLSLDDKRPRYMLNNGSVIAKIIAPVYSNSDNERVYPQYDITIDLNGPKGPNTEGKDVFLYRIYLTGGQNSLGFCSKSMTFDADTRTFIFTENTKQQLMYTCKHPSASICPCGALIQLNGWKIPDDYPHKF